MRGSAEYARASADGTTRRCYIHSAWAGSTATTTVALKYNRAAQQGSSSARASGAAAKAASKQGKAARRERERAHPAMRTSMCVSAASQQTCIRVDMSCVAWVSWVRSHSRVSSTTFTRSKSQHTWTQKGGAETQNNGRRKIRWKCGRPTVVACVPRHHTKLEGGCSSACGQQQTRLHRRRETGKYKSSTCVHT